METAESPYFHGQHGALFFNQARDLMKAILCAALRRDKQVRSDNKYPGQLGAKLSIHAPTTNRALIAALVFNCSRRRLEITNAVRLIFR